MKICIYQAVYGRYDCPHPPLAQSVPCDSIYFTDQPHLVGTLGSTKVFVHDPLPKEPSNILKSCRLRLFPFECPVLNEYDLCIYADGNAQIISPDFVKELLEIHHADTFALTLSQHTDRNDIYE